MNPARRSARAALDAARPAVARLDATRGSEDLAADLIEIWSATEAALRTLVSSNALAGQALIREARQRQLIDFDLANALAAFEAVHGRLQSTSYRPIEADVTAARTAFLKLDAALMDDAPSYGAPSYGAPAAAPVAAAAPIAPASDTVVVPATGRYPRWLWPALVAFVVALAVGGYVAFRPTGSDSLAQGIDAYSRGQREVAVNAFSKAVRENPKDPTPHVYLARMARDVGNFSLAGNELQIALEADPNHAIALREMGANLLQQGNYELARRFYVRAVTANPEDKSSMGYLGCTLMKLGRTQEAGTFMTRAGPGPWTGCTPAAPAGAPQQVPPGAAIPR
jgi:tetratricopeptide (TPR) repeat protein